MNDQTHRAILGKKYGFKCYICDGTGRLTIDHVIPKFMSKYAKVDVHDLSNKRLACSVCNNKLSELQSSVSQLINPYIKDTNEHKHVRKIINFFKSDFGQLALRKRQ